MKKTIGYNIFRVACIGITTLLLLAIGIEAQETAQLTDDTIVYYTPGKKRCHLADCKRCEAGMATMTWAEAKAKGLPLCSKCPSSETFVYYMPGKKRCHLADCKRRKEGMAIMKLSEAKTKGLPLCSKCPTNTATSATAAP